MNSLKRYIITGFIFISILGTLSHFFYLWSGKNPIIGLFSPVNESTWEHMKLLFFPALLYLIYIHYKEKHQNSNITSAISLGIIIGTFLIPVIFYTYTGVLGNHLLFLDILTFYLSIAAVFLTAYKLADSDLIYLRTLLTGILIVLAVCFAVFTFYPPQIGLFLPPV